VKNVSKNEVTPEEIDGLRKKAAMVDEAMRVVKDSADQLEMMKSEKDELERQAKGPLVRSLAKDSTFSESDLAKLPHEALAALRDLFDGEVAMVRDDWFEERRLRDEARARRLLGTVGSYDQQKGTYEGGVVI
jgi:hypothetical protein